MTPKWDHENKDPVIFSNEKATTKQIQGMDEWLKKQESIPLAHMCFESSLIDIVLILGGLMLRHLCMLQSCQKGSQRREKKQGRVDLFIMNEGKVKS